MNFKRHVITAGSLAVFLFMSGCQTLQQTTGMDGKTAGAVGGGALGCVGGAVLAKLVGGNAAAGCVAGAVVGGLVGFENARKQEIAAAEQAKQEAMQALARLPASQGVRASEVRTVEVTATEKSTRQVKKYQAFDSVTLDIPLSVKGSPEHEQAMQKLKDLATRVADERGSAEILVGLTPTDAAARKVSFTSDTVKTAKGNHITVKKYADQGTPAGMERVTVKAGVLRVTDV